MQVQPKTSETERRDQRKAKQAAMISDDTFKGGAAGARRRGLLRSPWSSGTDRLWPAASRAIGPTSSF